MDRKKTRNLRILSHIIVVYMLPAFIWWGILLTQRNNELYETKLELLTAKYPNAESTAFNTAKATLHKEYKRQRIMIVGEGASFIIALLIGISFINRAYSREIEAIRQKRNFLLAITHELKSPLASIGLIFETFKKRNLQGADKTKLVNHGLIETERLSTLIKNLLLSAQIDKSYQPDFQDTDLNSIINKVIEDILKKHEKANIIVKPSPGELAGKFDQFGIYSVFYNLIENAIKYSGENAPITIVTNTSQDGYTVSVFDQGIGISDGEKKKVFQQFYRSGQEETRRTKGTGIGLYIVKKMVDLHHGKIDVLDNSPNGTIFRVFLPKLRP
ncbi:MAG: HAMP domain-containing histidine kinase [Saprospiraceae bacterium]|nr:HAMP domain-containing histidine kinase [Saprospiraceae bacterium]